MKFAVIGLLILAVIFSLGLWSSLKISGDVREILNLLEKCEYRVDKGEWEAAFEYSGEVLTKWEEVGPFLAVVIRHERIDRVYALLLEMEEYMRLEEHTEFKAANITVQTFLAQLIDEEGVRLVNIL